MENIQERMAEAYQHFGYMIYGDVGSLQIGEIVDCGESYRFTGSTEMAEELAKYPWKIISQASLSEAREFAASLGKRIIERGVNYYKVEAID